MLCCLYVLETSVMSVPPLVEAVMLMGSTSKEDSRDIYSRLAAAANTKNRHGFTGPEIKLCYVTVCLWHLLAHEILLNPALARKDS